MAEAARTRTATISRGRALRALSEDPDIVPRRLFTVLLPLHQVLAYGEGRPAESYETIEWFIVRAIKYGAVRTIADLCAFYNLDEPLVHRYVAGLTTLTHLVPDAEGKLALTDLGLESLQIERRIELPVQSVRTLYFDAYTCQPLLRHHYELQFIKPADLAREGKDDHDRVLFSFAPWRDEALQKLADRHDRADYNVPGEIQKMQRLALGRAFLRMHIAEVLHARDGIQRRVYLNKRWSDTFFEQLFAQHPGILAPIFEDESTTADTIRKSFDQQGWPRAYELHFDQRRGWRALVTRGWLHETKDPAEWALALGEYRIVHTHCVQVWSLDQALRLDAACNKIVAKLEDTNNDITPADTLRIIATIASKLEVDRPDVKLLVERSRRQSAGCAEACLVQLLAPRPA